MCSNENNGGEINDDSKRAKNDMLKLYYGINVTSQELGNDPFDINSSTFKKDVYLRKLKHVSIGTAVLCYSSTIMWLEEQ